MSLAALAAACAGQPEPEVKAPVDHGALLQAAEHHDASPPLALLPPAPRANGPVEHEVKPIPRHFNTAAHDPVLQQTLVQSPLAPALGVNFDGIGQGIGGFTVNSAPPDTTGDVGPNHYVALVNSDFAVFSKSGAILYGPVPTNTLWSGFGGGCQSNNDGDGIVQYDQLANRWLISQFSVSTTPYLQCVAVSQTGDPTGAWNRYSFQYSSFPDYPKFGVWPDAYYVTFNLFNGNSFAGGMVCAYDRAKMLAGAAATQQCFNVGTNFGGLLPADLDGATLPPAGSPNYVVALGASAGQLAFWKFHADFTTPGNASLTGPITLATAGFAEACNGGTCIPQSGTGTKLDSLADRLMYRFAYRNFGDHESLVVNHSITAGSSTGVRWYELRSPSAPVIFQQGTYAPDSSYRWMGSIAMDGAGNIALGYSVSSGSIKPQIHFTGRLAGDSPGVMTQGESVAINGTGSQTQNLHRWGDYSTMSVDPTDDCTFWYTDEYLKANGSFNWSTRINSFKLPGCPSTPPDFGIGASPGTLGIQQGNSGTSTIGTTQIAGPGTVALSASVSPADPGVSVSIAPASVSAGGSATLTVSTTSSATVQGYTVTVTGTEGASTHSTTVTVNVTAPPPADFSISANPSSLPVVQGSGATSTVSTAQVGSAGTVSLSASVSPADPGVTAALSATSVAAGGGSTLTVSAAPDATLGSYTVTVTGVEGGFTHSVDVAVTVSAPAPADFGIAADPASLTLVQGNAGSSAISTTQLGSAGTVSLSATVSPDGAGVTASLADASVAAGNGTSLNVAADGTALGSYTITVTGVEGSATHSATVTLTVNAPPPADFTIAATPGSLSVAQGASGSGSVGTTQVGSAGTVALSIAVSPDGAGVSASLGAGSVAAGSGTSLSVSAAAGAVPGAYTVTVTGVEGGFTHSASVNVTVTSASCTSSTQLLGNPGFESGAVVWTSTPAVIDSSANPPPHSGTWKAWLDGYGKAHTDDVYQSVTIPSGACSATLSFWLKIVTAETTTVTPYDTLTVTVRDGAGNVLTTLATYSNLNKSSSYVQKSFDVSAFKGQTVRIQFHGVEDSSLATSFFVDDTALNVVQ